MIRIKDSAGAIVLSVATLALVASGCSASTGETPKQPPATKPSGLASLDMCSVFNPEEIRNFGLSESGVPFDEIREEPGCDFIGEKFDIGIAKNQSKTVASYGKDSRWVSYNPTSVNGRPAAQAISASAQHSRMCFTLFDAGGGVIVVNSSEVDPGNLDECAQSLKVAESIEPRMPR